MQSSGTVFALELPIPTIPTLSSLHPYLSYGHFASFLPIPITSHCSSSAAKCSTSASTCNSRKGTRILQNFRALVQPSSISRETCVGKDEEQCDVEVANGYTMTKFCDKMIEYFMREKPQTKDWRKVLVFRDDWKKYRDSFFNRCEARADAERDPLMNKKLNKLARKMKKVDDEIEMNSCLLKEIQDNPLDLNAIVARRRKDFTRDFFSYLDVLSEVFDGLEDRDVMARLGAKCLSAVCAYDNTVEHLDTLEAAQSKLDDILNSSSLEVACETINHLAKAKELDSSLILLINRTWAAAKESSTIKNEVCMEGNWIFKIKICAKTNAKRIMGQFQLGLWIFVRTPKELHKWIKMMLDSHYLNKEETDLIEARQMSDPIVIQRLFVLKETIEEEYMKPSQVTNKKESEPQPEEMD